MQPVRFSLDDLNVESFYTTESGAGREDRGTVVGYTDQPETLYNDCTPDESEATPTCIWYVTCDQSCEPDPKTYAGCGGTGADCNPVLSIELQCWT